MNPITAKMDPASTLADRPLGSAVRVVSVAWDQLESGEARRLRALGIDVGAVLKLAHRGIFAGRDPIAVEVGRMTVALRRAHALAIMVEDAPGEAVHPAAAADTATEGYTA
ncbi:FeoA family protein [Croceicoccus ponticola]